MQAVGGSVLLTNASKQQLVWLILMDFGYCLYDNLHLHIWLKENTIYAVNQLVERKPHLVLFV